MSDENKRQLDPNLALMAMITESSMLPAISIEWIADAYWFDGWVASAIIRISVGGVHIAAHTVPLCNGWETHAEALEMAQGIVDKRSGG